MLLVACCSLCVVLVVAAAVVVVVVFVVVVVDALGTATVRKWSKTIMATDVLGEAIVEACWGLLVASWRLLGDLLAPLGVSWGPLGSLLGRLLGPLWGS